MLDRIADDVFAFTDDIRMPGMWLPSRTTLVRRSGRVLIHSPLAIDDARAAEIEALGEVDAIVAPSKIHFLFLKKAIERWPRARVWGAPGLETKAKGVAFEPLPQTGEIEGLRLRKIEGFPYIEEHVFLHEPSRTLVVTDLVFNIHRARGIVMPLYLRCVGAWDKVAQSVLWKILSKDEPAAKRTLADVLAWDFDRVVMAHGDPFEGKATLTSSLAWLTAG